MINLNKGVSSPIAITIIIFLRNFKKDLLLIKIRKNTPTTKATKLPMLLVIKIAMKHNSEINPQGIFSIFSDSKKNARAKIPTIDRTDPVALWE